MSSGGLNLVRLLYITTMTVKHWKYSVRLW